jgi:hypothetical protein
MTKYLAAFALAVLVAGPARAEDDARTFEPATLTTGVAFSWPTAGTADVKAATIDTRFWDVLDCGVALSAGDTRSIIPKCYAERAGTNLVYTYPTMTVAAAASARYLFDPRYGAATDDTGTTASPAPPCRYLKITAASAGVGVMSCTLRKFK